MKSHLLFCLTLLGLLWLPPALRAETLYTANEGDSSLSVITWPGNGESLHVPIPDMPHNIDVAGTNKFLLVTGMSGTLLVFDPLRIKEGPVSYINIGRHPAHVVADRKGGRAFVTLSGENAVAVADLESGEVLKKIPVGKFPHGLRLNSADTEFYVANMKDGSVSVVSAKRLTETARIPVGKTPVQVAVAADGKTLYVSLNKDNAVAAVDIATRRVVKKIAAGPGPVQLFIAGDRLLVANQGSAQQPGESVTVIDTGKNEPVAEIAVGRGPHGVTVSADATTAFVTNVYAGTVSVIDLSALRSVAEIPVGEQPNGIAVSAP